MVKAIVGVVLVVLVVFASQQCIEENRARDVRERARAILFQRKAVAAKARWETLGVLNADELLEGVDPMDTISIQRRLKTDLPILMCRGLVVSSYLDSKTGRPVYQVQMQGRSSFRVLWQVSSEVDLISGRGAGTPYARFSGCRILKVGGPAELSSENKSGWGDLVVPATTDGKQYDELEPPVDI